MPRRTKREAPPIGVVVKGSLESVPHRPSAIRARVTWIDPETGKRDRMSSTHDSEADAEAWITTMQLAAGSLAGRAQAIATLAKYGDANMQLALRGLENKPPTPTWPAGASGSFRRWVTSLSEWSPTAQWTGP